MLRPTRMQTGALAPIIEGTGSDGARFVFAIEPADRHCCVMRNGDTIFTAPADESGIDAAVELLLRACGHQPETE